MKLRRRHSALTNDQIEFIFDSLGEYKQRKSWFNFPCPYHNGEDYNFGVNFEDAGYNCFVCGMTGSTTELYRDLKEGIAKTFPGIGGVLGGGVLRKEREKDRRHILGRRTRYQEDSLDTDPIEVPVSFGSSRGGQERYLPWQDDMEVESDRWADEEINRLNKLRDMWFRDRYTPLGEAAGILACKARLFLEKRRVDCSKVDVGFLDGFEGRVIFPFVKDGLIVYFQGRSFYDMPLKTINPDEKEGWPHKTEVLYNYDGFVNETKIVIGEGIFDGYSAGTALNMPYTCLLGSTIDEKQIDILKKTSVRDVLVFLDSDANAKGCAIAVKLWECKFNVKMVVWPEIYRNEKHDPNSIRPDHLLHLVNTYSVQIDHISSIQLLL